MAATIAAVCIGEGSFVTMPFIVGAISERLDFSSGAAAMVISFQFACMAVTSGLLSAVVHRIDRRLILLIAGGLISVCKYPGDNLFGSHLVFFQSRLHGELARGRPCPWVTRWLPARAGRIIPLR